MRPNDQRRDALKARAKPKANSKKGIALVKRLFADKHGDWSEEYAAVELGAAGDFCEHALLGLALGEYMELRAVEQLGTEATGYSRTEARKMRIGLMDFMRKVLGSLAPQQDLPSMLRVIVTHKSEQERAANRGPGVEVK